jgi:hypothetical protein
MLKFVGDGKKGLVYFLGLTRENINQVVSGRPIPINLADMGGPDIDVCILFGETEQILFNYLKKEGLIPPEVVYHEPTPGKTEVTRIIQDKKGG